jgi:hypothetical protein
MGIHQPWEKGVELELHGTGGYRARQIDRGRRLEWWA